MASTTLPLTVMPVPGHGAEDVLVADDGSVYTGTEDGSIFRIRDDGALIERVGHIAGRPLGLEWLADGRLLVCDGHSGLLALDPATGAVESLTDRIHGLPILVCNNAAVHSSGDIYFSDSSQVFRLEQWRADLVTNIPSGRLVRRRADGSTQVVLERLRFANGVALSADESFVVVAETGGRCVVRRFLDGPRAGETDHLVTDLPGYPDNVSTGSDGLIWVTIASPVVSLLERLMAAPRPLRRLAARVPTALQPAPVRSVRVMAFDDTGRVVHDLSADPSEFHLVTGVREHDGRVWLGSLDHPAVAVITLPASGVDGLRNG